MKISVIGDELAFHIEDQIRILCEQKINNIELRKTKGINIIESSDNEIRRIQYLLQQNGISVSMIATNIGKKERTQDKLYRDFYKSIYISKYLKCNIVRIFSNYSEDKAKNYEWINTLLSIGKDHGVTVVLENEVNTCADNPTYCMELIKETDNTIRFLFDLGNYYKSGFSWKVCDKEIYRYTKYVHLKDMNQIDYGWNYIGEGDLEVRDFLKKLKQNNYNGVISLEPHFCIDDEKIKNQIFAEYLLRFRRLLTSLNISES